MLILVNVSFVIRQVRTRSCRRKRTEVVNRADDAGSAEQMPHHSSSEPTECCEDREMAEPRSSGSKDMCPKVCDLCLIVHDKSVPEKWCF